jgi:hypothetical protein
VGDDVLDPYLEKGIDLQSQKVLFDLLLRLRLIRLELELKFVYWLSCFISSNKGMSEK